MNKRFLLIGVISLMAVSFLAGAWLSYRTARHNAAPGSRKIHHYVDPMHPSYTSDKPGIAPDCGMQLEPVYADGKPGEGHASLPPGTVSINPDRMQAIGVTVGQAEQSAAGQTLRLTGRVVPDESRTYVINATIDGWITGVGKATTGSIVKKQEILANFYSPEFLSAVQAMLFALNSMDRSQTGQMAKGQAQQDQMAQFGLNLKQYKDSLHSLGMGDRQIEEMIRTRKFIEDVEITSPTDGILLARYVSPGQRFEKGKELYRIADLSRIWVLVDAYGTEAGHFKPGMVVTVSLPGRNNFFKSRVSAVPPIFDPTSRTLKVRLEVDNPGYQLRPDMFVDVELPVTATQMLSVPAEAVIDSGLRKTVFVEKSAGIFEPREVATGRSIGNRMEIVAGLKTGEKIAVSGTFLLDSESRMKSSAAGISGTAQQDPVCGMYLDEGKARAAGHMIEAGGKTNYFCSEDCKQKFVKNPAAKVKHDLQATQPASPKSPAMGKSKAETSTQAKNEASKKTATKPVSDPHAGYVMSPATAPMTHDTGKKHD